MQDVNTIVVIIILVMSVVLHEVAHGYSAFYFGDKTAFYAGRLTLNPLKHLDWFSSILLPAMLIYFKSPLVFGAAKPVPVNLTNLDSGRWPRIVVAISGIATNFFIAIIFSIIVYISIHLGFSREMISVMNTIILINLSLGFFNLLPIPPLDGSKVLTAFLPSRYKKIETFLDSYGFVILILVLLISSTLKKDILSVPVIVAYKFLTSF